MMKNKEKIKTFLEKVNESRNSKKENSFLITRNETIALFLFTALLFVTLYFVQMYITSSRINDIIEYSDSRINSILVVDSGITNISTNYTPIKKEDLKSIIDSTLDAHRLAINEDIKQAIRNNNDVNNFWLSFIVVIVLIFSIFTIIINRDYSEKTKILTEDFQKKIDENKDLSIKFMRELISLSNQNRNIQANASSKSSVENEVPNIEFIDNLKREIIEEMQGTLYDIKTDMVELFGSEILEIYNSINDTKSSTNTNNNTSTKKSGDKSSKS